MLEASPSRFEVNKRLLPPLIETIAIRFGVYASGLRSSFIKASDLPLGEIVGDLSAPGSVVICSSFLESILTA